MVSPKLLQYFPPSQVAEETYRPFTSLQRLIFYIFALGFAFDFRSGRGDISPVQIGLAALTLGAAMYFWILPKDRPGDKRLQILIYLYGGLMAALLFSYIMAGFLHDDQARFLGFIRLYYPYTIVLLALGTCQSLYRLRIDPKEIITAALILILLLVARQYLNPILGLTGRRRTIINAGFVFSYAIAACVFEPKLRPTAIFLLVLGLTSAFATTIRSIWVVFFAILALSITVAAIFNGKRWFQYLWRFLPAVLTAFLLVGGILSYVIINDPEQVERWNNRLFPDGDFTLRTESTLIRFSLIRGMQEDLGSDPLTWLVGRGTGARFYASDYYERERPGVTRQLPHDDTDVAWMNILHRGGLISAALYSLFHVVVFVFCISALFNARRRGLIHLAPYAIGLLMITAVMIEQFINNIFHSRSNSMIFGLVIGSTMLLWAGVREGFYPYEKTPPTEPSEGSPSESNQGTLTISRL